VRVSAPADDAMRCLTRPCHDGQPSFEHAAMLMLRAIIIDIERHERHAGAITRFTITTRCPGSPRAIGDMTRLIR